MASDWSCSVGHFTFQGAGVGLLPSYTPLYTDNLHPLQIPAPPMGATLWMVWNADGAKDPLVRRCLDTLSKAFTKADWMRPCN